VLAILAYVVLVMPFGEKTLFDHLVNISKTDEAADLKKEITKKVDDASTELKSRAKRLTTNKPPTADAEKPEPKDEAPPPPRLTDRDRERLEALIRDRSGAKIDEKDRLALDALIHEKRKENR
jgi:hypothetical protein